MKKLIKNYTTDIPVDRTIAEIQKILAQNGARGIALDYDGNGNIKDIFFKIILNKKELPFRLPAKVREYTQPSMMENQTTTTPGMVTMAGGSAADCLAYL